MMMNLIYANAAAKWKLIPAGALRIGCHGCVAATSVWCAACPVRGRWERKHGVGSLVVGAADPMPRARLRGGSNG